MKKDKQEQKYIKIDINNDEFTVSMTEKVTGIEVLQASTILINAVIEKSLPTADEKEDKLGYTE